MPAVRAEPGLPVLQSTPARQTSHPFPGLQRDAWITLAAAGSLLAWDASGADLRVMRWIGSSNGFALHEHWLTAQVLHGGGRWLSLLLLLALLAQLWRPLPFARSVPRTTRLWWLLTTLGAVILVPWIKSLSLVSCPWDLAEFGGAARFLPHWTWQAWQGLGDGGPGRCFPSGHAAGAFAFVTGWFALRGHAPRAARRWLVGIGVLGLVFGLTQVLRGAHHPSHVAWAAWLCWTFAAVAWHAASWQAQRAAAVRAVRPGPHARRTPAQVAGKPAI